VGLRTTFFCNLCETWRIGVSKSQLMTTSGKQVASGQPSYLLPPSLKSQEPRLDGYSLAVKQSSLGPLLTSIGTSPQSCACRSGFERGRPAWCVRLTWTVAIVFSRSFCSLGLAESKCAPSGVPAPSTRSIHLVPFPRLVLPTLAPPFSRGRSCRPRSTHPNAASGDHSGPPGRRATVAAMCRSLPRCAGVSSTWWGLYTSVATRSRGLLSRESRGCLRSTSEHRLGGDLRARSHDGPAGVPRGAPIARR